MLVIARPRQMGKTTDLITYAAKHGYLIITSSEKHAKNIWQAANKFSAINLIRPMSWWAYKNSSAIPKNNGIVVDDVEIVLGALLNGGHHEPLRAMTVMGIPEQEYEDTPYWKDELKLGDDDHTTPKKCPKCGHYGEQNVKYVKESSNLTFTYFPIYSALGSDDIDITSTRGDRLDASCTKCGAFIKSYKPLDEK